VTTFRRQAKELMKMQTELGQQLQKARNEEMKLRITFERGKEEFAGVTRRLTIELSELPNVNQPDPKTGRTNQEWTKMLLDQELENNEEFRTALVKFWNLQEGFFAAQSKMIDLADQLSITKSQARLLSALLQLEAEDEDEELKATVAGTE